MQEASPLTDSGSIFTACGVSAANKETANQGRSSTLGSLAVLCAITRSHQIAADSANLAHQLGCTGSSTVSVTARQSHLVGVLSTPKGGAPWLV